MIRHLRHRLCPHCQHLHPPPSLRYLVSQQDRPDRDAMSIFQPATLRLPIWSNSHRSLVAHWGGVLWRTNLAFMLFVAWFLYFMYFILIFVIRALSSRDVHTVYTHAHDY